MLQLDLPNEISKRYCQETLVLNTSVRKGLGQYREACHPMVTLVGTFLTNPVILFRRIADRLPVLGAASALLKQTRGHASPKCRMSNDGNMMPLTIKPRDGMGCPFLVISCIHRPKSLPALPWRKIIASVVSCIDAI